MAIWISLKKKKWFWLPTAISILGLVSIGLLTLAGRINERQRAHFLLADAAMDIQIRVANSHLWLEEIISGDADVDISEVWENLGGARTLAKMMVEATGHPPARDFLSLPGPNLKAEAEALDALVGRIETLARVRATTPGAAGIGSNLDEEFDALFLEFEEKARALEFVIEERLAMDQMEGRSLHLAFLLAWTFVVGGGTLSLWHLERGRAAAKSSLERANEQLKAQTAELNLHRGHLVELIAERTAELTSTNRHLKEEIAERRRTMEELEESKNRFERLSLEFDTLLQAIPDALTLFSRELTILWANKGASSYNGMEVEDLTGRTCYALKGEALCKECPALRSFVSGENETAQMKGEDGRIWDVRAFPIKDDGGQVINVIEIATEITEKITLQAEASRVARLASLGELAAGVAHEINNPINGIINYAQILLDGEPADDGEIPGRIIKEGQRIATIVRSLLSFARKNKTKKSAVDILEVLTDALSLTGRQLEKEGIHLDFFVPETLPPIYGNAQQIEQVILNVINNARYALNEKYTTPDGNKILEISAGIAPGSLFLAFRDHGTGIPAHLIEKVRDPFFSTKPQGEGTGLGLSISHGIVTDHGGKLILQSTEGEFTRVLIILPTETAYEYTDSDR